MKSWTDFIANPTPVDEVAAVGPPRKPIPLHERPTLMEPVEAQHQLRADMSAACADMTEQVPNGSYDVMGWLTTPTASSDATFSVATWNMNRLDRYKLAYVCMLMQQDNLDVVVMTDTRHSAVTMKAYVRILKDRLGAGTAVYGSVDAKRRPGEPGGIITVIGPRWGPSYVRELSKTDFSGHGVLTAFVLDTADGRLSVLGSYWPSLPDHNHVGKHGLWARIHEYRCQAAAHDPDPILYVQDLALQWIASARVAGCKGIFLAGDLNSTWTPGESGGQRAIRRWCEDNFLINGPKLINEHMQSPFITHGRTEGGRNSWIDHVLHTGNPEHVSVLGACNALGEELDDISDHKPLWGLYLTAPPLAARHVRMERPPP